MLFARADRPVYFESHGDLAGLARGHRRGLLWRLHNVLELRLGDGQDAGRRRVAARYGVCRGERRCRVVAERRWHPAGQSAMRTESTARLQSRYPLPPPSIRMNVKRKDLQKKHFVID